MARRLWVVFLISDVFFAGCCGLQASTGNNVGIYGGHDVSIEETPYMAGIYSAKFYIWFYRFQCGGAIIHEKIVLTAAHCVVDYYSLKVAVGSEYSDEGDLLSVHVRITRKDYDTEQLYNDIALLKLVKPVQFGVKVAAIQLPDEGYEVEQGTLVTVTGWGGTETSAIAKTLRQVTIPILPEWKCRTEYEVCAGSRGLGTCNGDSGSPLVYNNMVIGVVSHRRQHACAGPYGTVYIRVASYTNWIKQHF